MILGLSIDIGSYTGPEEHESHILETVGSGNWYPSEYDEFRFDRDTGMLRSLRLHIPEQNVSPDHPWLDVPATEGSIRLTEIAAFDLEPPATRWVHLDGSQLGCLYTSDSAQNATRLRIAPSFDLLISSTRVHGWLLSDPERFMVKGWEFPQSHITDSDLARLLRAYFNLVAYPGIELIENQDPTMLKLLRDLAEEISVGKGAVERREALRARVEDVIDFFYD
jgi:hypothetical protein